ncbi:MAG: hypothetical protein NTY10_03035 [Candidatus Omnitrophica bacterium]|nr:hypothetical protein [Candidatus Omnitrophota bacterium]
MTKRMILICLVLLVCGTVNYSIADEAKTDVKSNRELWEQLIQGKNLALGKTFTFSRVPADALTSSPTDSAELTDGKLITYPNDRLWFDRAAVGWFEDAASNGVNLLTDLGREEDIGNIVIRTLAGNEQGILSVPRLFEVYLSKDGKDFYEAASLQKLAPGEKAQSDFIKYFYIPENGVAYTYPLEVKVNARARYVGIRIYAQTNSIFIDEIAVMEAKTKGAEYNLAYQSRVKPFYMRGIMIGPRIGKFVITSNISAPNSFAVADMRDKKNASLPVELVIEVPKNIILEYPKVTPEIIQVDGQDCQRFKFINKGLGDWRPQTEFLFFKATGAVSKTAVATIYALCGDEPVIKQTFPVEVIALPVVTPAMDSFQIDLTWTHMVAQQNWPNFYQDWRKLGFYAVTGFPQYYHAPERQKEMSEFVAESRKQGYKVVMTESPFHELERIFYDKPEIFSQRADGKASKNLCPSYTGEFYQKELDRISQSIEFSDPDFIHWDIECWYGGALDAMDGACTRCNDAIKASNLSKEVYLRQCGVRMLKDLKEAVRKGRGDKPMPVIGSYNHQAAGGPHHFLFAGMDALPNFIDQLEPSVYVAGRGEAVHRIMRENYLKSGKQRKIFPWLSAGTYGEFDPQKMEYQVYEALLNGGVGFGYYWFGDFDTPLDYYYHAKALATVAPYQAILKSEDIWLGEGSNKELFYSGVKKDNQMLLLVGNYQRTRTDTVIKLPFVAKNITDLRANCAVKPSGDTLELDVPKGDVRLFLISGE